MDSEQTPANATDSERANSFAFLGDTETTHRCVVFNCWICSSEIWMDGDKTNSRDGPAPGLCFCKESEYQLMHVDCKDFLNSHLISGANLPCPDCNRLLVPLDTSKCKQRLLLSARSNSSSAQLQLAKMYMSGTQETKKSEKRAIAWAYKAVNNGNVLAQKWLGITLYSIANSRGKSDSPRAIAIAISRNVEARKLFERSSAQGHHDATRMLGDMHFLGQGGLTKSPSNGNSLWRIAAKHGNFNAAREIRISISAGLSIKCFHCGEKVKTKKTFINCEQCYSACYCSSDCRTNDAKNHERLCNVVKGRTVGRKRVACLGKNIMCFMDFPGNTNSDGSINLAGPGGASEAANNWKVMKDFAGEAAPPMLEAVEQTKAGDFIASLRLKDYKRLGMSIPCFNCSKSFLFSEIKRCSRCKGGGYYCSPECQKDNWQAHKTLCNIRAQGVKNGNSKTYSPMHLGFPDPNNPDEIIKIPFDVGSATLNSIKRKFVQLTGMDIKNVQLNGGSTSLLSLAEP